MRNIPGTHANMKQRLCITDRYTCFFRRKHACTLKLNSDDKSMKHDMYFMQHVRNIRGANVYTFHNCADIITQRFCRHMASGLLLTEKGFSADHQRSRHHIQRQGCHY